METVTLHKKKIVTAGIMAGILIIGIGVGLALGMHRGYERGGYEKRMGQNMQYQGNAMHSNLPQNVRMMPQGTSAQSQKTQEEGVGFEVTASTTTR